jgi:hypothetical protein
LIVLFPPGEFAELISLIKSDAVCAEYVAATVNNLRTSSASTGANRMGRIACSIAQAPNDMETPTGFRPVPRHMNNRIFFPFPKGPTELA